MSDCPACQSPLPEDFGLIDCPSCGMAVFIDMEGNSTMNDAPAGFDAEGALEPRKPSGEIPALPEEPSFNIPPAENDEVQDFDEKHVSSFVGEEPVLDVAALEVAGLEVATPVEDVPVPAEDVAPQSITPVADGPVESFEEPGSQSADPGDLGDIADYANSSESMGREGLLRFHLRIRGIDSVDTRDAIKEALTDKRFIWDADRIISEIEDGVLNIRDMTPVKAFLVVDRIKSLPVQIEWDQYAIHAKSN